ncbi:MAG: DUF1887 family protein [Bacteroidales bacterium]|jgi:Holliday junction resolvase|nr:DUF1887 family protein [Bacteroidales bacterium]
MTYLVSLISEHLLPNFLFIKEMEGKYDELLFVTTQEMEDKAISNRLEKALGLNNRSVGCIKVFNDNLNKTIGELKESQSSFSDGDEFIVNITGGTKLISIAVYEHFKALNTLFYYIPISKNTIYNVQTATEEPMKYQINVKEYLALYGLTFTCENTVKRQDNKGAVFETYICNHIKNEKRLKEGFIYRGVKLFRADSGKVNDNEIDVIWTAGNQIFVSECKVSLRSNPMTTAPEYLDQIMYKLAAISKDFGLRVNPYIFTQHNLYSTDFNEARKKAIEKRMKILGIKGLYGKNELKENKLNL